jgi:hypothetical protein
MGLVIVCMVISIPFGLALYAIAKYGSIEEAYRQFEMEEHEILERMRKWRDK